MKKLRLFLLVTTVLLLLCSCSLLASENGDNNANDRNDVGPSGSPGQPDIFDDNMDKLCDYCNRDIATGYCNVCLKKIDIISSNDYDKPNIEISVPENALNKTDSCVVTITLSETLDVSNIITDVFLFSLANAENIEPYFTSSDARGVEWSENKSITISLTIKDDVTDAGSTNIRVTSRWLNTEHQEEQINRKFTKDIEVFYASNDTHIAFSTISIEDAKQKLN